MSKHRPRSLPAPQRSFRIPSTQELLNEIAFYRDIAIELEGLIDAEHIEDLRAIEQRALQLQLRLHDVRAGLARIRVAVVGSFSSGKSSLINSLLRRAVCPV